MTRQCAVCGRDYEPPASRGRPPMTCSPECALARKNVQSEQSRQRLAAKGCPERLHGTSSGYNVYRCSCSKCSRWARLYRQELRKAST